MAGIHTEQHGDHLVYVLQDPDAGSRARILPDCGFNCYSFECRLGGKSWELLHAAEDFSVHMQGPDANGTPVLFPFPNRIRNGRFDFEESSYQLPLNEPGGANAIHGLAMDRRWRVQANADGLLGVFQLSHYGRDIERLWPADFRLELVYLLVGNKLVCKVRISNPDMVTLPWGFGTHPYFKLPLSSDSTEADCSLQVPATEIWQLEQSLPTGRRLALEEPLDFRSPRRLEGLQPNHLYTGLQFVDGWCECLMRDEGAGVEISYRFDQLFRELVLYVPQQRGALCIEPYTCLTDAANLQSHELDAGWRTLGRGQSVTGTVQIEARLIAD